MNNYWKYHLGLVGQIIAASAVYGVFIFGLSYIAPAEKWKGNPGEWALTLSIGSAALAATVGLSILGVAVMRDYTRKDRR